MANIYGVYCAVKLVLFKYGLVKCDSFKEILKYLRLGYLKKLNCQKIQKLALKCYWFGITEAININ